MSGYPMIDALNAVSTPRETADHAELTRRLRVSWPDRGWVASNKIKELLGEAREAADAIEALLSEIAALRASASVIEPELGDLEATNADLSQRLTQAERQRDELRKALEFYAQPIWSIRGEFPEASPHSEYRPDCGDTARQALANQGADQ